MNPVQLTVTTLSDLVSHTGLSLRDAIVRANSDANVGVSDQIAFSSVLNGGTIDLSQGALSLTGKPASGSTTITINADSLPGGITISGNGHSSVLQIGAGVNATIEGLSITGGSASDGGGVDNAGDLNLAHCIISGNTASSNGGGIDNTGTLSVANCTVSGNDATTDGGGIASDGTLTVSGSTISANSADSGGGIDVESGMAALTGSTVAHDSAEFGGGVYNDGTLNALDSTISNNSGGGVGNDGTMTSINTTVADNVSSGAGGGINNSGTAYLSNSIIAGDTGTTGPDINNSGSITANYSLIGNSTESGISAGNGNILDPTFLALGQLGNHGGTVPTIPLLPGSPAIDAGSNALAVDANGNPLATDERGDTRTVNGTVDMGAYEVQASNLVTITSLPAVANGVDGGFVISRYDTSGASLTVNFQVSATTAPGYTLSASSGIAAGTLVYNSASKTGSFSFSPGAQNAIIDINGVDPTHTADAERYVVTATLTSVSGTANSGAYAIDAGNGGATAVLGGNGLIVTNTNDSGDGSLRQAILNDNALAVPGAITLASGLSGTITLSSTLELDNVASSTAKPEAIDGPGATSLTISGNNNVQVFTVDNGVNAAISGLTIEDGSASDVGGGIGNNGNLTLSNAVLSSNTAQDAGGAIYNNGGTLTVTDSTFTGNTAQNVAGAIYNYFGTMSLVGSTFDDNKAPSNGGCLFNFDGGTTITNTAFSDNSATNGDGGAIYNWQNLGDTTTLTVIGSTFTGNTSNDGSAIANEGGGYNWAYQWINNAGNVGISNSTFSDNTAQIDGGVLLSDSGTVTISGSTMTGNSAKNTTGNYAYGGALDDAYGCTLTVTGCTLSDNYSPAGGGIFSFYSTTNFIDCAFSGNSAVGGGALNLQGGTLNVTNCTLSGNTASYDGGAFCGWGGTATVTNTTISGNSAVWGGGIYINAGAITLQNSILALDTGIGSDAYNQGATINAAYSLIGNSASSGISAGNGNILNPAAVDLGPLGNYGGSTETIPLLPGSPAIAAGSVPLAVDPNNNPLITDQRGDSRTINGTVDMGAYEVQGSNLVVLQPLGAQADGAAGGFQISRYDSSNSVIITLAVTSVPNNMPSYTLAAGAGATNFSFDSTNDTATFTIPAGVQDADIEVTGINSNHEADAERYSMTATLQSVSGTATSGNYTADPNFDTATANLGGNGLIVTNTNSSGDGSLAQAILNDNALAVPGTITFQGVTGTINLNNTLELNNSNSSSANQEVIQGPGANVLSISGGGKLEVFKVDSNTTAQITGLTITDGGGDNNGGGIDNEGVLSIANDAITDNSTTAYSGGGIYNDNTITVTACTINNNTVSQAWGGGGGIDNQDFATIVNSTICDNTADGYGGGIENNDTLTVINSTISGNTVAEQAGEGGGIINWDEVTLQNSVVAGNTASYGPDVNSSEDDIQASYCLIGNAADSGMSSGSGNILNPVWTGLAPLANNGGPTQTIALLPGSPALDAGNVVLAVDANGNPLTTDQAGNPRTINGTVDMGAYEAPVSPLVALGTVGPIAGGRQGGFLIGRYDASGTLSVTLTITGGSASNYTLEPGAGIDANSWQNPGLGVYTFNLAANATTGIVEVDSTASNPNEADAAGPTLQATISVTGSANSGSYSVDPGYGTATATLGGNGLEVTTLAPTGAGSLAQAILNDNALAVPGPITFASGLSGTITLANTLELSNSGSTVANPESIAYAGSGTLTISGNKSIQPFEVDNGVTAAISGLTISQGKGYAIDNEGTLTLDSDTVSNDSEGGVYSDGSLIIIGTTFSDDSADSGGAISSWGTLAVTNSIFTSDTATGDGGAIHTYSPQTATISGCTFTGDSADDAGAIYSESAISISGCTFTNNSATDDAGAIYSEGDLNIADSTFSGNMVTNSGGPGGAVYGEEPITVSGCSFSDNSATSGGAIYGEGSVTALASTFSGNHTNNANARGGAIFSESSVAISSSTLSGNQASGSATEGGAVYAEGTLFITDSTLSGNSAREGGAVYNDNATTILASTLSGNTASSQGGGIYNDGALTLQNALLAGNTANTGPDIDNAGSQATIAANYSLIGNTAGTSLTGTTGTGNILNPSAVDLGVLVNNGGPTDTMALLPGSPALDAGNAVLATLAAPITTTTQTTITVNNAALIPADGFTFIQIDSEWMTVTSVSGDTLTVVRGADGTTAATHLAGAGLSLALDQCGNPRVANANEDIGAYELQPTADAILTAPAPIADGPEGEFQVTRYETSDQPTVMLQVTATTAPAGYVLSAGAGIASFSFDATAETATFTFAAGAPAATIDIGGFGNGTEADAETYTMTATLDSVASAATTYAIDQSSATANCGGNGLVVTNTNASGHGSLQQAILNDNALAAPGTITFDPGLSGQTITVSGPLTLSNPNSTSANPEAIDGLGAANLTISGGGTTQIFIVNAGVNASISDVTIADGSNAGDGGAIFNSGTLTIQDAVLSGNQTTAWSADGGAIYSTGTLIVTGCTLENNSTGSFANGGAIYNYEGALTITDSTLSGNDSTTDYTSGGAVFNQNGVVTVTGSTFIDNAATDGDGGAIYNYASWTQGATLTITASAFVGNTSTDSSGGAIYTSGDGSYYPAVTTATNSTFTANSATSGGAFFNEDITTLINCTVADNSAVATSYGFPGIGGGIYNNEGTVVLQNTIVAGNTATSSAPDIFTESWETTTKASYSLIGNTAGSRISGGSGNILNPAYVGLGPLSSNGGPTQTTELLPGSPAIDAGSNAYVVAGETDQRGDPRIVNGTVDIGAFELGQPGPVVTLSYMNPPANGPDGILVVGSYDATGTPTVNVTITGGSAWTTFPTTLTLSAGPGVANFTYAGGVASFTFVSGATLAEIFVTGVNPSDDADAATYTLDAQITASGTNGSGAAYSADPNASSITATLGGNGLVVTNTNDSGDGSLRQAILNDNALAVPGPITFAAGLTGTITLDSTLELTNTASTTANPETIVGPGAANLTIDGNGSNGLVEAFQVDSGVVADISGVTVTDARPAVDNAGTLTLDSDAISGNGLGQSSYSGTNFGITSSGTLAVNDCTLADNSVPVYYGGALDMIGGTVTVTGSTFTDNSGAYGGGAIYCGSGTLTVSGSTFVGNSAANGGAIEVAGGTATLINSTFTGNSAGNGGAIYASATATLTNCTVVGNSASYGGGLGVYGTATLNNCIVAGNTGTGPDVNIVHQGYYGNNGTVTANYSLIGNSTDSGISAGDGNILNPSYSGVGPLGQYGGPTETMPLLGGSPAIAAGSPALAVDQNGNPLTTDQTGGARIINGTVDMGAYEVQGENLVAIDPIGPTADSFAGGFEVTRYDTSADLTVEGQLGGGTAANYTVSAGQGAASVTYDSGTGNWQLTFASGAATADIEISFIGASNEADAETYTLGATLTSASSNAKPGYYAIDANSASATATLGGNGLVVDNTYDSGDGSLRQAILNDNALAIPGTITFVGVTGSIGLQSTLTLSNPNSTAANPEAIEGPGAATLDVDGGGSGGNGIGDLDVAAGTTASIQGLTISGGYGNNGAGLYNDGAVAITDCVLTGDIAAWSYGGALDNNGTMTVVGGIFTGNSASYEGGAIYNSSSNATLTVENSTFTGNSGEDGGAIDNNGGTLVVAGCTFDANSASNNGGAIANFYPGNATVTNSTFSGNSASYDGGAVDNYGGTLAVAGSEFDTNTASYGGGIANYSGSLTVTNSTFSGNPVSYDGGAIYMNSGTALLTACTVTGNTAASGGGIYNDSYAQQLILNDTIVAGNTASTAPDIDSTYGAPTATYSLIGNTAASQITAGDGNVLNPASAGLGTLNGGPTESIPLLPGSPALGAGNAVLATLAGAINATQTTITVNNASLIPADGATLIQIDGELMTVTSISGDTLTVVRGADGSTPAIHNNGAALDLFSDQRGDPRANPPDIGAYEATPPHAVFTSSATAIFMVGQAGTFTIAATSASAITFIYGQLPAWATFTDNGNGTATLAGTRPSTVGVYSVNIVANVTVGIPTTQVIDICTVEPPTFTSASNAAFTVGQAGSFAIKTSAGLPSTTTLTESGALPNGVNFVAGANGTASLTGKPAAGSGGVYDFTITANNGPNSQTVQNFTLTVNEAPAVVSTGATFTSGQWNGYVVTTHGFPLTTLTEAGTLPAGVSFCDNGNDTATLYGTPATGSGGIYSITISAAGSSANASQTMTLTVEGPPTITSIASTTFLVGAVGAFTITTKAGAPAATMLACTGKLPAGVSFVAASNGTAKLVGTPSAGMGGTYTLTITASNASGKQTQTFTLTVDQPPAITSAAAATFVVGVPKSFTVTTTGFPTASLTTPTLPAGLTFTDNGNGTATISGTVLAGNNGPHSITITASNGVGASFKQTFTLTIDQPPTIGSASNATFTVGKAGSFSVTTSAGYPTATTVTESGKLPTGVVFSAGKLVGTPAAGTGGTYNIVLTAASAPGSQTTQDFRLTVDQAPAITSANTATLVIGSGATFTVKTTGFPTPTISALNLPTGVSLSGNTLSVTSSATGGVYHFSITASNGVGAGFTQPFTLTIDQPPTIGSASNATFTVGKPGSFSVTTSAGYPTATTVTESGKLPTGVVFSAGKLIGTPAAGTGGTYNIVLTARNTAGLTTTQDFTLTVDQAPAFTSAAAAIFVVGTPGSFTVTTTGFPSAALSATALPAGLTFVDNGNGTATISGTPYVGTAGSNTLTISAANSASTVKQTFTLTIDQAPIFTSSDSASFTAGAANTFTFTTAGFPTAKITESGVFPAGLVFVAQANGTATLSGTPKVKGTFTLLITASNGVTPETIQVFTLTVS